MIDIPDKKCRAQEFYTRVRGMALRHDIPKCTKSGYNCCWFGDETKCNSYVKVAHEEGGDDGSK